MPAEYAFDAANMISDAFEDEDSGKGLAEALKVGCRTLRRIEADLMPNGSLYRDFIRVQSPQSYKYPESIKSYEDVDFFIGSFLPVEKAALLRAGAKQGLVDLLCSQVRELHKSVATQNYSPEDARKSIDLLRMEVCVAADEVKTSREAQVRRGRVRRLVRRSALAIGGSGVIAFNASGDLALSFGLLPWMSAVSLSFGGVNRESDSAPTVRPTPSRISQE